MSISSGILTASPPSLLGVRTRALGLESSFLPPLTPRFPQPRPAPGIYCTRDVMWPACWGQQHPGLLPGNAANLQQQVSRQSVTIHWRTRVYSLIFTSVWLHGSSTEVLNMKRQLSIQCFINKKAKIQEDERDPPAAEVRYVTVKILKFTQNMLYK